MVNESKNMYIPEDTLENHQGTLVSCLFFLFYFFISFFSPLFFLFITGKHLVTVHERGEGRGGEGVREV